MGDRNGHLWILAALSFREKPKVANYVLPYMAMDLNSLMLMSIFGSSNLLIVLLHVSACPLHLEARGGRILDNRRSKYNK